MILVSYDIKSDMVRTRFSKMLVRNGAFRLQYSVYEVRNTQRIMDILVVKVEAFSKYFTADDSVLIIEADGKYIRKFGNAIHRDKPVVYF